MWGIVLSSRCGVCGAASQDALCSTCSALLQGLSASQWIVDRCGVPLVRAVGRHDGALREVILAWKERGRADLTFPLSALVRPLIPAGALVVPIPTRPAARRVRGECVISSLADHLGAVSNSLTHQRRSLDQTDVDFRQRTDNVKRTLSVKASALPKLTRSVTQGRPIVVLDDVYTTGATVREATRALHRVNIPVSLVVVIAAAGKDRWRSGAHRTSV